VDAIKTKITEFEKGYEFVGAAGAYRGTTLRD